MKVREIFGEMMSERWVGAYGMDEKKTIVEVHRAFAEARKHKRMFITKIELSPGAVVYHYVRIRAGHMGAKHDLN